MSGHEIIPQPGTAYTVNGAHTGQPANLLNSFHYPVEALCLGCGEMIRCDQFLLVSVNGTRDGEWHHLGRRPGEAPTPIRRAG